MPKHLLERIRRLPFLPPPSAIAAGANGDAASGATAHGPALAPSKGGWATLGSVNESDAMRDARNLASRGRGDARTLSPQRYRPPTGADRSLGLVSLQRELHAYARAHLTTAAVARHLLERSLGRGATSTALRSLRGALRDKVSDATHRVRVLLLSDVTAAGSLDPQMSAIIDGLQALGARTEALLVPLNGDGGSGGAMGANDQERRDAVQRGSATPRRQHGRRHESEHLRSSSRGYGTLDATSAAAAHAHSPYSLLVVRLTGGGDHDDALGRAVARVLSTRAGALAARNANGTRVACVRSELHPPPMWRVWLPPFCSVGFVREARLL